MANTARSWSPGRPRPSRSTGEPPWGSPDPSGPAAAGGGGQGLPDPAVQQPPAGQAGLGVDEVADQAVAEVVDVPADLVDQAAGGQLLQGGHRLLVAAAAGRPGGVDVEGAAEHGRGRQDLAGGLADPADPGGQQV